jgi:hypothetical protein
MPAKVLAFLREGFVIDYKGQRKQSKPSATLSASRRGAKKARHGPNGLAARSA